MTSVGVDVGVMWRLSEDFNRRFVARVQHHHHRPGVSMLYNGKIIDFPSENRSFNLESARSVDCQ